MLRRFVAAFAILLAVATHGAVTLDATQITLGIGAARQLKPNGAAASSLKWESSDPKVAAVYGNGFVIGLTAGTAKVHAAEAECTVTVKEIEPPLVNPSTLKQFSDTRRFEVNGRKCYGSELNGQRASDPSERQNVDSNRVINPKPLAQGKEKQLEWELEEGTEIYDGAGVLMGTVPADFHTSDGRTVPTSKFNFGMSKVLNGKTCLYAFAVALKPTPEIAKLIDPKELNSKGAVSTSAWLPLDRVVDKETLLERIGVGKVKLPRLPLQPKGYKITGGNPKAYMTDKGELRIVKDPNAAPVPSHYLRRPSGTVNILYSVPGFGLGGQGTDSFLISDGIVFRPAKGARTFTQATYLPAGHPNAGKPSSKTMTFIYGAAEVKGVEPVYGWVAKEALAPSVEK